MSNITATLVSGETAVVGVSSSREAYEVEVTSGVRGDTGVGVVSADIVDGVLSLTLSNTAVINAGSVVATPNTGTITFTDNTIGQFSNGSINISTDAKLWTFGADGTLSFPDGTSQTTAYTGGGGSANTGNVVFDDTTITTSDANTNVTIQTHSFYPTASPAINTTSSWVFGSNGDLYIPGNIKSNITVSTWSHNIVSITLGTDTIVTFDADEFGGPVVGQVTISDGGDTPQATGTWWYQAWDVNAVKLYNDQALNNPVDSTEWTAYESGKTIQNIETGAVVLESGGNQWTFGPDGNMVAQGNMIVGESNNGNESHFIIDAQNYWTSIQWKNMNSLQDPSYGPFECQAQLLRVFANDNTVTQWCNVHNPREELIAVTAVKPSGTNYNGLMFSTSDGKIPDAPYNDDVGTRHDWILEGDGTVQFPSMPTNGRTGQADALIFSKNNGHTGQKVIGTQGGTADNPIVERLVIAGGDGFGGGEGGDIYLWAGRSSTDANGSGGGGDIKVDAGDAYDSEGGTIKIRGGNSYQGTNNLPMSGGWIQINGGSAYSGGNGADISLTAGSAYSGGNGADVRITAGDAYNGGTDGKVSVTTGKGAHTYEFTNDGSLSIPGALRLPGSVVWPGNSSVFEDTVLALQGSVGVVVTSPGDATITSGTSNWTFSNTGTMTAPDGTTSNGSTVITSGQYDIQSIGATLIQTSANAGAKTWSFGTDAALMLPNNSSVKDTAGGTIVNGVDITTSDLGDWTSGPLDGTTYTNTGWDYIQFNQVNLYNQLVAFNNNSASNVAVPVIWSEGSTQTNGYVYLEFVDTNTFQICPITDMGASAPQPGTWVFPVRIGAADVSTVASLSLIASVGQGSAEFKFQADGGIEFPDTTVQRTAFTGDSNNALYLGGIAADQYALADTIPSLTGYQTIDALSTDVSSLTANNTLYLGGFAADQYAFANTIPSLTGYQTTAGLSANVAKLSANNTLYLGGIAAASYLTTNTAINTGNVVVSGNITLTGNLVGNTAGFEIGYKDVPQNYTNTSFTIALSDRGKHIYTANGTAQTITIANNASVAFPIGTAISIVSAGAGTITVARGTGVALYLAANNTSADRTISTYGMATLLKVATDTWFISGAGVA
jgi:hypothetical protein